MAKLLILCRSTLPYGKEMRKRLRLVNLWGVARTIPMHSRGARLSIPRNLAKRYWIQHGVQDWSSNYFRSFWLSRSVSLPLAYPV